MTDYRINRWEGCKVYHAEGMKMDEIDPACPMLKYIADYFKLDIEQRFWLAWLYSTCYSAPTAFYMITKLPRPEYFSTSDINNWWRENKSKLLFSSDRRFVKNFDEFPKMFESYRNYTRYGHFKRFLELRQDNEFKTYNKIFIDVKKNLYYFSNYSIIMYLEAIYNLTKFPMTATGIDLKEQRAVTNGLFCALSKDDWVRKINSNIKISSSDFKYLQLELKRLYTEILSEYPEVQTTYWNLETSLCAYYKLFFDERYIGFYIDRQMKELKKMQELSPDGADWDLFWKFRRMHFDPLSLGEIQGWTGIRKDISNFEFNMKCFIKNGRFSEKVMLSKNYREA